MVDTALAADASSANDHLRLAAAGRLGQAGPDALALLRPLTMDGNDFVRMAAQEAVFAIAREHGHIEAARLGMQVVRDHNLHVRLAAGRALKTLPRDLIAEAYAPPAPPPGYETDCLDRCHVPTQPGPLFPGGKPRRCDVCVAFVATPGFEHLLDMCLWSLKKYGELEGLDYTVVAFMPGADDACRQVCRRHHALCIEPIPLIAPHASMKGMIYSLHRWVDARCYLSLEPDMLVLGPLRQIVEDVLADQEGHLYGVPNLPSLRAQEAARRGEGEWPPVLQQWIDGHCGGDGQDVRFLQGESPQDKEEQQGEQALRPDLFFNAGLFLGTGEAFRRVEERIRAMQPFASLWIDTGHVHWRDEMVWNIACAQAGNAVALSKRYNYEPGGGELEGLRYDPVTDWYTPTLSPAEASVYHFVGPAKAWMPLFTSVYGISQFPWKRRKVETEENGAEGCQRAAEADALFGNIGKDADG